MTIECKILESGGMCSSILEYNLPDFDEMKGSLVRFLKLMKVYTHLSSGGDRNLSGQITFLRPGTTGMFLGPQYASVVYCYTKHAPFLHFSLAIGFSFLIGEEIVTIHIPRYTDRQDLVFTEMGFRSSRTPEGMQWHSSKSKILWQKAFEKSGIEHRKDLLMLTPEERKLLQHYCLDVISYPHLLELHHEIATHLEPFDLDLPEQDIRWWWTDGFKTSFPDDPNFAFARLMLDNDYDIELQRKDNGTWSDHKTYTP